MMTLSIESFLVVCNFDRARLFCVDTMDNEETAGLAFARLASEFIRTRVVPELDAFRLATYAGTSGISAAAPAELSAGADGFGSLFGYRCGIRYGVGGISARSDIGKYCDKSAEYHQSAEEDRHNAYKQCAACFVFGNLVFLVVLIVMIQSDIHPLP